MSIRKIQAIIDVVPTWGDDDFDAKVHDNFTKLKEFAPEINNTVDDINESVVAIDNAKQEVSQNTQTVSQKAHEVSENTQTVNQKAQEVSENTQTVNQKAQEVSENTQTVSQKAQEVSEKADQILNLTVEIETLEANELATINYNPATGILNIGIPEGIQGEKGNPFTYADFTQEQLNNLIDSIVDASIPDLPISKIINLESILDDKVNITDFQNLDLSNIVETVELKHFTALLKTKLESIAENANNYSHPETHDASMITESTNRRFVSDTEKDSWNGKLNADAGVPVGSLIMLAGNTVPTGYLKCNGASLSRTVYNSLFAIIGTTYGDGDGSTTFNLPDFRGEFIRGWDDGRGVDNGRAIGSHQEHAYENHSHTAASGSSGDHTHTVATAYVNSTLGLTSGGYGANNVTRTTSSSGDHTHTVTVNKSTSGDTETRPRNLAMMFCIKY